MPSDEPSSERTIGPVGQLPRHERADDHADAEHQQEQRDRAIAEPADLGDRRCDVGEHREHAAEADRAGEQGQPHLEMGERASSRSPVASRSPGTDGTNDQHHRDRHERRAGPRPSRPSASRGADPSRWRRARRRRSRPRVRSSPSPRPGPCDLQEPGSPRPVKPRRSRRRAASPSRNRDTSSISKLVATALSALNPAYAVIRATSSPRRGQRAPRKAMTGAPTTTPSA